LESEEKKQHSGKQMSDRTELWLVRHGETEWSSSGKHTGRTDVPLTDTGRDNAQRLAPWLAQHRFDRVWSSTLSRARDTATLAGFEPDGYLVDLCEWDYGKYEGLSTDEIRRNEPGFSTWTTPMTGGETLQQVGERADRVLQRTSELGGRSLLFAHAHLLRILAARWVGLDPSGGRLLALAPASVSVLGYEHETRVIQVWNLTQG
jgi:probable phosphoglycerate mutase